MLLLAHIAGVPVEETALSMAPVAITVIGLAGVRLRTSIRRGLARRAWTPRKAATPAGSIDGGIR